MTGMQHVEGAEGDANLLTIFFEFTYVVEYHTTIITGLLIVCNEF